MFVHDIDSTFVTDHCVAILKQIFLETFEFYSSISTIKPNCNTAKVGLISDSQECKLRNTYALLVPLGSIWQTPEC